MGTASAARSVPPAAIPPARPPQLPPAPPRATRLEVVRSAPSRSGESAPPRVRAQTPPGLRVPMRDLAGWLWMLAALALLQWLAVVFGMAAASAGSATLIAVAAGAVFAGAGWFALRAMGREGDSIVARFALAFGGVLLGGAEGVGWAGLHKVFGGEIDVLDEGWLLAVVRVPILLIPLASPAVVVMAARTHRAARAMAWFVSCVGVAASVAFVLTLALGVW